MAWRRVARGLMGAAALGACTVPNPAYHGATRDAAAETARETTGHDSAPDASAAEAPRPSDGATPETASPDAELTPQSCGSAHAAIASITGARGVAVDDDGTIYFTRVANGIASLGRLLPNGALDAGWFGLPIEGQPGSLRLDRGRRLVYVALSGTDRVVAYDLVTNTVRYAATNLPAPHGLAVHASGAVFVSCGDGHVYRILWDDLTIQRQIVTSAQIGNVALGERPLGLAFGPGQEQLYVGTSSGELWRYAVGAERLDGGARVQSVGGAIRDLAVDSAGRVYAANFVGSEPRALDQISQQGVSTPLADVVGLFSGLAFGRGVLACDDLYLVDSSGAGQRYQAPARGLEIP
jgi:DNA-binding beta-propeller fold protein YncE